ncbi:hypothetical protein ACYKEA_000389 [Pluralibacter gergoviae]|uniref:hypothetical protein n=1 Tax=Pluralibacter gergoviae TaxID=61647 RepID=UPI0008DBF870|nr:hypothetical protein [Pluralibacter gergoviae]OHY62586.1 hypothetical protein BB778_24045 [Pluralibacter gergoviae]
MMGYSAAIRQLDNGTYDHDLPAGMHVVAAIWEAERKGYYSPSDERRAIVWRWLVACLFILEQMDKNGTVDVVNEDGGTDRAVKYVGRHGGISIYPATERFSLANHIEGLALEKYGAGTGLLLAVQMYQAMTEPVPGDGLKLSRMGREGLEMLHDGFIEMLNTEGMPAEPTAH